MSRTSIISKFAAGVNEVKVSYANHLKKIIPLLWEHLPSNLPEPAYVGFNAMREPWITYPYDKELRNYITELLIEAGWKMTWQVTESELKAGNECPRMAFSKETQTDSGFYLSTVSIIIEFDDTKEGSTCVRKEIGKVTKEVPLYEFSCDEE